MSGKWKKIIWMICMIELCIFHAALLVHLGIHNQRHWILIFATGTLFMAAFWYSGYRRFTKECVQDLTYLEDEKIREIFCKAHKEAGNTTDTNHRIYANPKIRIPFVMGFYKQSVIVPTECVLDESLFFIFLHECYHIKRRDTLYKAVMLACNCLLWFHPLAYFIRYISYRDIEVSCDETVVAGKTKEERYQYGKFLVESAGKQQRKVNAYSAYWNDSKSILKCRIQAVMEEKRNWDRWAKFAVVFLLAEAIGLAVFLGRMLVNEYDKVNAPVNEFEDTFTPPMYTDEAITAMLELEPVKRDTYCLDFFAQYMDLYPQKEMEAIDFEITSPWQYKVENPGRFKDALAPAVQRFWYYQENQEIFSRNHYEQNPMYTTFETVYSDLVAGDIKDAVWGIIWKTYTSDYTELNSYKNDYVKRNDKETNYVYYSMAVHIKMVEPYVFEVVGFADLEETLEAFMAKYPNTELEEFPLLDMTSEWVKAEEAYEVVSKDEKWYLVSENAGETIITIPGEYPYMFSEVFVSFPESEDVGYLYAVTERVVYQEACILFKTLDGGKNWEKIFTSENARIHSLTMDFNFMTNEIGYIAIYSSQGNNPQLLRTEDGGESWEAVIFDEVPEYFSQAYAPEIRDGKPVLYVGMEEYSKMKGEKAYYESSDNGKSWELKKRVFRE